MWSAIVLGSGQDGGLPQFGARSRLDEAARHGQIAPRYSSSLAIVADDGRVMLLDVGPDLKSHAGVLEAHSAVPDPKIGAVALTHAHIGHYAGLIHFGREVAALDGLPCWVTTKMGEFLAGEAPWRFLVEQGHLVLKPQSSSARFRPWPDLEVAFHPVPHRHEASDTVAISIEGRILYVPDIDAWAEWSDGDEVIAAHDVVLMDATFWAVDELPDRDLTKIRHPLVPDTLERFGRLAGDHRLILTHLNHSNPVCDPGSAEHAEVLRRGFEVAEEGMIIEL